MRRVNLTAPDLSYDAEDPDGYRAGMLRLGPLVGGARLGASLYDLPAGQALCPYHYEYGEEEWLLVLAGRPTVRHPGGADELEALDLVCFPRGPEGAHQVRNESSEPVRVLLWSEVTHPTATVYPDSGKVGVWTGNPDDDVMVRKADAVGYSDGE